VDRCQGCLPRSEGIVCVAGDARYRDGSGGAVGAEGEDVMTMEHAKLGSPWLRLVVSSRP
jgi:hypothetical protein